LSEAQQVVLAHQPQVRKKCYNQIVEASRRRGFATSAKKS
jgi:lipocalin